ncbi:MAG: hypothetical protein S4CHLAM102_15040 [Chlamydiia bacterium]|nr:hypothetical protein [Chlamydiia bacterium]
MTGSSHVRSRGEFEGEDLGVEAKRFKGVAAPIEVLPEDMLCRIIGLLPRYAIGHVFQVSRRWSKGVVEVLKGTISPVRDIPEGWGLGELKVELETNQVAYQRFYIEKAKREGIERVPPILPPTITGWVNLKWVEEMVYGKSVPLWLAWAKRMFEEGFEEDVCARFFKLAIESESLQLVQEFLVSHRQELIHDLGCVKATRYFLLLNTPFWRASLACLLVKEGTKTLDWKEFNEWVGMLSAPMGLIDHTSQAFSSFNFTIVKKAVAEGQFEVAIQKLSLITDLKMNLQAEREILIAAMRSGTPLDSLWRQITGGGPDQELLVLVQAYVLLEVPDRPDFQTSYFSHVKELAVSVAEQGKGDLAFWMIDRLDPTTQLANQSSILTDVLTTLARAGYFQICRQKLLSLPMNPYREVLIHYMVMEIVKMGEFDNALTFHHMAVNSGAKQIEREKLAQEALDIGPYEKASRFVNGLVGESSWSKGMHHLMAKAAAKGGEGEAFEYYTSLIADKALQMSTLVSGAAHFAERGHFEYADQIEAKRGGELTIGGFYSKMVKASFLAKQFDRLDEYMKGLALDEYRFHEVMQIGVACCLTSDVASLVRLAQSLKAHEKREQFLLRMYSHLMPERPSDAFELVESSGLERDREVYLTDKATYLASRGDLLEAEKLLESIAGIPNRERIYRCLAAKNASLGRLGIALNWAEKIETDETRESAMQEMVEIFSFKETF